MTKVRLHVDVGDIRKNNVSFSGKLELMKHDHDVFYSRFDTSFFCIPFDGIEPAFVFICFTLEFRKKILFTQTLYWNDIVRFLNEEKAHHSICMGQLHTAFIYEKSTTSVFDQFDENDFQNKIFFTLHNDIEERRLRFTDLTCEFDKTRLYYI